MLGPLGSGLFAIVTERTEVHINTRGTEVLAVGIVNTTELVDPSDECTDEAEIDKGNEQG